jgi:hypothetical protein
MPTIRVKTGHSVDLRPLLVAIPGNEFSIPSGAAFCGMSIVVSPEMRDNADFGVNYGIEISRAGGPWTRVSAGGLPIGTTGTIGQADGLELGELPISDASYDFIEPEEGASGAGPVPVLSTDRVRPFVQSLGGNGGSPVRIGSVLFFRNEFGEVIDF